MSQRKGTLRKLLESECYQECRCQTFQANLPYLGYDIREEVECQKRCFEQKRKHVHKREEFKQYRR